MALRTDYQSLALHCNHALDPRRFVFAPSPALFEVCQFADVMDFTVALCATQFAGVGLESSHQVGTKGCIEVDVLAVIEGFHAGLDGSQGNGSPPEHAWSPACRDFHLESFVFLVLYLSHPAVLAINLANTTPVLESQCPDQRLLHDPLQLA